MALTISNIAGMTAYRNFSIWQNQYQKSIQRLSSGLRINSAADDPAGLAISERMRAQIRGLKQASRNAQDGISLLQTAEGNLDSLQAMVHRMRELSIQAANDTLSDSDRSTIQAEFSQLIEEIGSTIGRSQYNTIGLFDEAGQGLKIHIGANAGQNMTLNLPLLSTSILGLTNPDGSLLIDLSSAENANNAIGVLDEALDTLSSSRSTIGAQMNRLEYTISNLNTQRENLIAAESRIRDVDIAEEIMNFTNAQLHMQVAIAMMAQANLQKQMIIKLLFNIS